MGGQDKRRFKRLEAHWLTKIRKVSLTDSIRERMETTKNISLGGVFVESAMPFELGTIVALEFAIPNVQVQVKARGIVRWVNNGSRRGEPVGMGIEFLEVAAPGKDVIENVLRAEASREYIRALTKTPLHVSLLRFYCRKIGGTFPTEVVTQYLGCTWADLEPCLADFATYGLVTWVDENLTFRQSDSVEVTRAIQQWYEGLEHGKTPYGGTPASKG